MNRGRLMPERTLVERVEILERKVGDLELLPARVTALELQILQLRQEMRAEFSAVRDEIRGGDEETRRYMRVLDEETRRYMKVLHEELIGRIATIQEARRPPRKRT